MRWCFGWLQRLAREDVKPMDGVVAAAIGFGNTAVTVKSAIAAKGVAISCSKRC